MKTVSVNWLQKSMLMMIVILRPVLAVMISLKRS